MAFKPRSTRAREAKANTASIRLRHERFTSSEVQKTLSRAAIDPFKGRKTMRTYMRCPDGSYLTAKIDLVTGEVVPHQYETRERPRKVTGKAIISESLPPWMQIPAPDHGATDLLKSKRVRKEILNSLRSTLKNYVTLESVFLDYPYFENIIFGALTLDMGGNTRTLSPTRVLALLQNLKVISSESVETFMGCGERHAQKVALCLRVIVRAFVTEREREAAHGIYRVRTRDVDEDFAEPARDEKLLLAA